MTNRLLYLYFERQREIFLDVEIHGRLKLNHYPHSTNLDDIWKIRAQLT